MQQGQRSQAQALTEAVQKGVGMVRELAQSPLENPEGKQGTVLDSLVRMLRTALPGGLGRAQAGLSPLTESVPQAEPTPTSMPAARHEPKPAGTP